ncbi:MlaD family protein [Desulfocicer niacini]
MKKEPDKTLIGAFVVIALALTLGAVVIFGSGSFLSEKNTYVLYFKNSVKGLNIGSPVVLGGVKIGAVKEIRIHADSQQNFFSIPVYIEIKKESIMVPGKADAWEGLDKNLDILIKQGLRAQLEIQSMVTGQLLVSLDFHPNKPAVLHQTTSEFPEIPTIQSDIEAFAQKIKQVPIQDIFAKLHSIISTLETTLNSDKMGRLTETLTRALEGIGQLAGNVDESIPDVTRSIEATISDTRGLIKRTSHQITSMGRHVHTSLSDIQTLVKNTDQQVKHMGSNMDATILRAKEVLTTVNNEITPISQALQQTAQSLQKTAGQATTTLKAMDDISHPDSIIMNQLTSTLEELSDAARAFRNLTQYLERHPEALIQGKQ